MSTAGHIGPLHALAQCEVPMRSRVRALFVVGAALASPALLVPAGAQAATGTGGRGRTVAAGETWTVTEITELARLTVEEGAVLAAPEGQLLSLTVNGVETGSALDGTYGTTTVIAAGTYRGDIVLTPTADHTETFAGTTFHLRQAVYVGADGVVTGNSVLSGVRGGRLTDAYAKGVALSSTGEAFNGFYVAEGASYTLTAPKIAYDGNGRCDFATDGAAVTGKGDGTRLVIEDAEIRNKGAVRTGVIAYDGANVIVKNSVIHTDDGVLPDDYKLAMGANMMTVPWMLGLAGNVRATNVLGTNTTATYLGCAVSSERWGVLSTDSVNNSRLTTINSSATITGDSGYGTYADGGSQTDVFLGTHFDVATFAAITTGGSVSFGDSTREAVAAVDTESDLRLTARELAALTPRASVVDSRGFGVMWHSRDGGTVTIDGGTRFTTAETMFLVKAVQAGITVDGSGGARLRTGNGVLVQVMETDDPGSPDGVYTEPTDDPAKDDTFDTTDEHDADVVAAFTSIELEGDFYNAMRTGKNLVVSLTDTSVRGVISASVSRHAVSSISADEYQEINHVTNTTGAAVNNGVIVKLGAGSAWTVTGTSYLTKLVVDADATVGAPSGRTLTLTVDGTETVLTPGATYTGALTLTAA
ncbi:hypothetical protein [Streptomyces sp. NPDC088812]|uniref:hypothetical protein n=1 Tax=Streptomyces sp. NPDC088812 TaxID=3365905 RepID=UPI003829B820